MNTIIKKADSDGVSEAVKLLQNGEIAAIPTETVYGLAANALDPVAIEKIFTAKGRPLDNPLIVHVSGIEMARKLGLEILPLAERLAERFWAGALTMIFRRTAEIIPPEVSRGLDTVAVRAPDNPAALEIIRLCGFPLAAPSANASGSPSPTSAQHVLADLNGKIPLIIDGGECRHGLESTVIAFGGGKIRILRPGAITPEMLSEYAEVIVDDVVFAKAAENPKSPGTAHKHYSPKAHVIAVFAESADNFTKYVDMNKQENDHIIAAPEAPTFFARLRELDALGAERIFIRLPEPEGIGLALYNRIIRAAEFNIIKP